MTDLHAPYRRVNAPRGNGDCAIVDAQDMIVAETYKMVDMDDYRDAEALADRIIAFLNAEEKS